jgi:hypothetical protein
MSFITNTTILFMTVGILFLILGAIVFVFLKMKILPIIPSPTMIMKPITPLYRLFA